MKRSISDEEFRARLLKPLDDIHNTAVTESDNSSFSKSDFRDSRNPTTLVKYISNPTGKGTAYVANRSAIKQGLNLTYIKLLREYRRAFYAQPYIYGNGDILFYVKVPSEDYKNNKISYDVLFLLKYDKSRERKHREMRVYSNSPSFIFTYCYVYNKNNMLIDFLKSKLPTEALTMPPEIRNPIQSFGFEKSTYIAARYLLDGNCLTDAYINLYGKTMNDTTQSTVLRNIADPELLISIYQHAKYEQRKTHKRELTNNQLADKRKEKAEYIRNQKKIMPKKGFIVKTSPRSKITARKAQRSLMNENKKKK